MLKSYAAAHDVELLYAVPYMPDWFVLSCSYACPLDALDMVNLFFESDLFASAEPEFVFKGEFASNDTYYSDQWGLHNTGQYSNTFTDVDIKVTSAWKISKGRNSLVAIYDNGVYLNHADLTQNVINSGFNAQVGNSPAAIYGEHGTACAGIVAAEKNEIGVVGVAPEAGITSISIGLNQFNTPEQYVNGFKWARENSIDIISNSWGSIDTSFFVETAIIRAINEGRNGKGCVVVFASGNINDIQTNTNVWYPGKFAPEILVVGAVSPCGERKNPQSCDHEFWGSCYGEQLDIMAPGVLIPTTDIPGNGGYNPNEPIHIYSAGNLVLSDYDDIDYTVWFNGTSSACPHVSGVAALILSVNPDLLGQEVCNIIETTAKKVRPDLYVYSDTITRPNGTWNKYMGYGLLDAHRAVLKAAYHKVYGDTALTLCDTNRHVYTVRAPHNANIDSVSFFWTCSDNLQMVAGQNTDSVWVKFVNSGVGQLQCHIIHDGDTVTSMMEIPIVSDWPVLDNQIITNGITHPDTLVLSREIVVDTLSGVCWQDKTVLCTPDCRIIVPVGGYFMINHTTLTSACPGEMWQGVEVMGDSTKQQILHNQGHFFMENGSIIENAFTGMLNYGIYVSGTNGFTFGGLQMLCGSFNGNSTDIYFATNHTTVSPIQGNAQTSAGNTFVGTDDYNIENTSGQNLDYYYTGRPDSENSYYPSLRTTNVLPYLSNTANSCTSTLCDGGSPRSLAEFQSDMNTSTNALSGNTNTDGGIVETQNLASLQTMRQSLSETYHAAVRAIMSDTVLDLNELEQWHTVAQPIADPYSLTETRFMEGYAETFAENAETDAEMANYADFHALKLVLRDNGGAVGANNHSPLQRPQTRFNGVVFYRKQSRKSTI